MNYEGIAGTDNGINGNYNVAITTDGHVNASMVTFGEMNGNLIKANSVVIGALDEEVTNKIDSAQSSADKANTSANSANANASTAKKDAANANASAQQAGDLANTAKADAAAANTAIQTALKQIDKIQANSNEAKKLASDAFNGISPIAQVVKADTQGLKVLNSKDSTNYAQMQDVGFFIFVSNNQVAEFGIDSKMRNMAIQDYLMFASHRAETAIIKEEESTAFYWIGDVK